MSATSAAPSASAMSIAIERLPRLVLTKYAASRRPSFAVNQGGPQVRVSSPCPGRSTLITSAPRSANSCVAQGPARTRLMSTTRMLSSARVCRLESLKGGDPRLCAAQDQCVNVMRSLVGVDRLQVAHVTHHVEFVTDTVAPMHVSGFPSDGQCLAAAVALDERNVARSAFALV